MKYYLYSVTFFLLSGCITNPTTGKKKLLGAIPVPFTGFSATEIAAKEDPKFAVLVAQLEKFSWIGIVLVIAGAFWWKLTDGSTGLGKTSVAVGLAFIAGALLLPQIAGYIVLATILATVLAVAYAIYYAIKKKGA